MQEITLGSFANEDESCAFLDSILIGLTSFKVYKEITGELMHPRYGTKERCVRIDRILVPKPELAELGWCYGAVGIECKRSGLKIGRPLSQCLDYTRAIWCINSSGVSVHCRYVFLWPAEKTHGTTASIMAQNNIGTAHFSGHGEWERLALGLGESNLLQYFPRTNKLKINEIISGAKTGSR